MRITIQNTPELVHANGLPVRQWVGLTESGHPVLALVTRITSPTADGTSELERELSEAPTRVVDPSGSSVSSPRWCTTCIGRGGRSPARLVARDADGLEWYECGDHSPTDNLAETTRVELEPIGAFFDRHMLPRPSNAPPVGDIAGPGAELEARVAELASECRSLRVRLKAQAAPWLVKDFHALYLAAAQTFGTTETPAQAAEARAWLELQLARLSPAFEHCESARSGAPERLTAAERQALDALHRWLHSPAGDCDLIEAAQDFHAQIDDRECDRIERHEQREIARSHGLDAHIPELDAERAPPAHDLEAAFVEVALLAGRDASPNANGALTALAQACDESGGRCSTATPPLSDPIIVALASHPRVSDRAIDTQGRGAFLAYALRGAQMGWHARHAHPRDVALIARASGPLDEPHRSAWLTGYRIAVDAPPETVAVIPIDPYDPTPMAEQAERPAVMRPVSELPHAVRERLAREPGGER